ncbi:unnamed protein product [Linum tenue]|uniref:F-box domain-containing protein n=1 Tax=Linum tenue TaxID=586396 RepID=A0AAV0HUE9_9ROSI|nr:unnamed protein product [Linum tenue]
MDEDPYFGKLPAELLGKIAIALLLDEAARTSVLTRRWQSQWRSPALPYSHFAGNGITKFMPDDYPISCFDTVGEFLSWVDQVIRRRELFPLRPARTRLRNRRTEFSIDSLGLNFEPEDPHCGWIEFNKDRSKTTAPLVDGACICCRSKVIPTPTPKSEPASKFKFYLELRMDGDPYFGKLPAELLGKIATALPLDEAARTSVLCRRWRSQWRSPALPNSHFAGTGITKFMPDGYPISCFDTVGEFLSWVDQVIRRREPFPLRPARTRLRYRRTEFSIDSLGLNFDPEDPNCGWIEFNKDRSKTTAPLVDGACTCCRSKAVSFLTRPQPQQLHGGLSLSSLLSGRRRKELLKQLTLRNYDMDILRFQFASPGNSFM